MNRNYTKGVPEGEELVMIGTRGCGQRQLRPDSVMLSEQLGIPRISTGDLFTREHQSGTVALGVGT